MENQPVKRVIVVTGGASGLGAEIGKALARDSRNYLHSVDLESGIDVRDPQGLQALERVDILINCAGINAQDWIEDVTLESWNRVMDTNARAILTMTQALLPQLIESRGTILNITSNAAWMPMTCSIAYNASKAAAHIMTLQMARELTRKYGITVFGVAPNKLRGTGMSAEIERQVLRTRGWSAEFAREYQLKALLTGEETDPAVLADFIAYLLAERRNHSQLSGCIIPYGS